MDIHTNPNTVSASHESPSHLQHHFDTPAQQFESGKLGMWIFLATEVLFFGGLFVAYAVYRSNHPEIFIYAHQYLDKTLGGINTVILICSSLTMAWAVRCAQLSKPKGLLVFLSLTLLFACGFLGIKFVEYKQKWEHGLGWGKYYRPTAHAVAHTPENPPMQSGEMKPRSSPTVSSPEKAIGTAALTTSLSKPSGATEEQSAIAPAAVGPADLAKADQAEIESHSQKPPSNVHIFFGIYFVMTGLHGIHVIAGMIVISWLLYRSAQGRYHAAYFTPVDLVGLYWHLVDLIWIYLFPLLYLIH